MPGVELVPLLSTRVREGCDTGQSDRTWEVLHPCDSSNRRIARMRLDFDRNHIVTFDESCQTESMPTCDGYNTRTHL